MYFKTVISVKKAFLFKDKDTKCGRSELFLYAGAEDETGGLGVKLRG